MRRPYLPTVKAMAQKRRDRREIHDDPHHAEQRCRADSRKTTTGLPRSCTRLNPNPSSTATNRTGMMSPLTKGSTKEFGMMSRKNSVRPDALGNLGVGLHRLGIERGRIGVEARSHLPDVADDHSDDQRQRRGDLEIDQRLDPDIGDVANVAHFGNAKRDGGEDDRPHHDLDRLHEGVAERLEVDGKVRKRRSPAPRRERPRSAPARKACDRTACLTKATFAPPARRGRLRGRTVDLERGHRFPSNGPATISAAETAVRCPSPS